MQPWLKALLHPLRACRFALDTLRTSIPESCAKLAEDAGRYWNGSGVFNGVRDMSHWEGQGRWQDGEAWGRIGQSHVQMVERFCRTMARGSPIESMVEWGPGGGANAVHFCSRVQTFYGVDISSANLDECGRQLESRGFRGFRPVLIDSAHPEQARRSITEPVDLFLSTAVYQHFPGKEYGVEVTRVAHRLLAPDGLALIQIRYDDGSAGLKPKRNNYADNVVSFTSYPIDEFWDVLLGVGLVPVSLYLDPANRYAYYFAVKGKTGV